MSRTHIAESSRRRHAMMPNLADIEADPGVVSAPEPPSPTPRRLVSTMMMCVFLLASCVMLYGSAESLHSLSHPFASLSASRRIFIFRDEDDSGDFSMENEEHRLQQVLKDAAMEDGTVILTTLNDAWAAPGSIIYLFLESFRIGDGTKSLLNHLVIVALDERAYKRCLLVHGHCYALVTEGVDFSQEAYFMTGDYLKMMWRRIDFLRSVLEMGHNILFTDADVMWFRNPFPHFDKDADFQIACDHFTGDPESLHNLANGGFSYVKSSNQSIEFFKFWYASRQVHPGRHDQDVFNVIKFDSFITDIGLNIKFLDTTYFGGLCEPSRDMNLVCTMHANCCAGLDNKISDLKVMLEDWKWYMALPQNLKTLSISSWHVPQSCSLDFLEHMNHTPEPSSSPAPDNEY